SSCLNPKSRPLLSQAALMSNIATQVSTPRGGSSPEAGSKGGVRYRIPSTRRLVPRASERRSKMIAFGYYGGKFSHLDFIVPLLPTHLTHYCEVFGIGCGPHQSTPS